MYEGNGVKVKEIEAGGLRLTGIGVDIPDDERTVLQIRCRHGLLFCGLFATEAIEALEMAACVFSAPQFEDMLGGKPKYVSKKAKAMGVTENMTGFEIAAILDK